MKIKTIFGSMLAIAALSGCAEESSNPVDNSGGNVDVAYVSLEIEKQLSTRSSEGHEGSLSESKINSLHLLLFDKGGIVVGTPDKSKYYVTVSNPSLSPDPIKVSAGGTKLLLIANPGPKLLGVMDNLRSTTSFSTFNAAIKAAGTVSDPNLTHKELTDPNFTMINSGDEGTSPTPGQKITEGLIDITGKIYVVSAAMDEAAAIENAKNNRVKIKIERLASKLNFALKGGAVPTITVNPAGAKFSFLNWTLDAVNSTYYPWATKTLLEVVHTGGSYKSNFYTEDPNFSDSKGIVKATIDATTFAPKLPTSEGWMGAPDTTYCIENTMAAAEQRFGNATRLVVKGSYYPPKYTGSPDGDWFSFAGIDYLTFDNLLTAYTTAGANLKNACDDFYSRVYNYLDNKPGGPDLTTIHSFTDLTQVLLDQVENGGEVVKNGSVPVIRWYQKGLCYYYYEMRHDNETSIKMGFGKYGVVRNNWYSLTLGTVEGAGTPWYPDIDNPGPGDPDPTDPIDPSEGYLGIEISIAPWIIWENEITIGN